VADEAGSDTIPDAAGGEGGHGVTKLDPVIHRTLFYCNNYLSFHLPVMWFILSCSLTRVLSNSGVYMSHGRASLSWACILSRGRASLSCSCISLTCVHLSHRRASIMGVHLSQGCAGLSRVHVSHAGPRGLPIQVLGGCPFRS
jgi:hypothetical protein